MLVHQKINQATRGGLAGGSKYASVMVFWYILFINLDDLLIQYDC